MAAKQMNNQSPDTLQDLCFFYCANNVDCLSGCLANSGGGEAESLSVFSVVLGNRLLEHYLSKNVPSEQSQAFIDMLLLNQQLCSTLKIHRKGMLSRENIQQLATNTLRHLDLTVFNDIGMIHVEEALGELIKKNRSNIVSLKIKDTPGNANFSANLVQFMCHNLCPVFEVDAKSLTLDELDINSCGDGDSCSVVKRLKCFSYTSNLKTTEETLKHQLVQVLKENPSLQSFSFTSKGSFPCADFLPKKAVCGLHNLTSLILSSDADKPDKPLDEQKQIFASLPKLQHLQHLDLSYGLPKSSTSPMEGILKFTDAGVQHFKEAVLQMPKLTSLDISGTNLTDIVCHPEGVIGCDKVDTCMAGFENRRFDYLGLFYSEACRHEHIPADKVSGTNSEDQLMVALWAHQHNCTIMYYVVKEIQVHLNLMKSDLPNPMPFYEGMVAYLEHSADWTLPCQVNMTTSNIQLENIYNIYYNLYYLIYYKLLKRTLSIQQQRRLLDCCIISCNNCARDIPNAMGKTKNSLMQINRTSLLIVLALDLHKTTLHSYCFEKFLGVLMRLLGVELGPQNRMLLLGIMHDTCRLHQDLKVVAGRKMKLVQVLLEKIEDSLEKSEDVNMEVFAKTWSILWTLTDEAGVNSELFVRHGGCDKVLRTCEVNPSNDLKRKVSGAMCNVAEVAHIRPQLMTEPLVKLFRKWLEVVGEAHYDTTSHSVAFLVLLAADGPDAWTLESPSRDDVIADADRVIREHWDLTKAKGVRFRSLKPMAQQLDNFATPAAQNWAAWTILNLVIVQPDDYCIMVLNEGVFDIIVRLLCQQGQRLRPDVKRSMDEIVAKTMILSLLPDGGEEENVLEGQDQDQCPRFRGLIMAPDSNRYCPMAVKENVLEVLHRTLANDELRADIRELMARITSITEAFMGQAGPDAPIAD